MALAIRRAPLAKGRVLATLIAVFALVAQPLVALNIPAAFALGAQPTVMPASHTIEGANPNITKVSVVNATGFENLKLSFNYIAENLDNNDQLLYGWRTVGGVNNQLGHIDGKNETGNTINSDETGVIMNLSIPAAANNASFELYFTNTGKTSTSNNNSDIVEISNVIVSGDAIPVVVPIVEQNAVCSSGCEYTNVADAVAGEPAGSTITIKSGSAQVITSAILVNKQLTITGEAGASISTSGSNHVFVTTAPGVIIRNLNFVKTDKAQQNLINIQGANTTISANTFAGQYSLAENDHTSRALEVSTTTGLVVTGNTFNNLRQPAYINDNTTGSISNNYINQTRGWVATANTDLEFTGNSWGENAVDIAFIPGSPNNYDCDRMNVITLTNNNARIDNQAQTQACVTQPPVVVPVADITTPREGQIVATAPRSNQLHIAGTFRDDKAVNYLQLELVRAGNLVTVYTMHYNNPGLNSDGTFAIDMPVPANLASGEYSLFYTGTDFDNGVTSRMERKFTIDNTAPVFSVANISEGVTLGLNRDGKLVVMGSFSDALSGANYIQTQLVYKGNDKGVVTKHGAIENGLLAEYDFAALESGSEYYIAVSAADVAGNFSERMRVNFTVDKTPPSAPTTAGWTANGGTAMANGGSTNVQAGIASWSPSASDDFSYYTYKYWNDIPGNGYKVGSEYRVQLTGTSLPGSFTEGEGVHHFCIEAVDHVGNVSSCTQFTITYDKTAPIVTVAGYVGTDTTPTLSGTIDDPTSDITLTINGSSVKVTEIDGNTWSYTVPEELDRGVEYELSVSATDAAGNASAPGTASVSIQTLATTSPVVPVAPPASPAINDGTGGEDLPIQPLAVTIPGFAATVPGLIANNPLPSQEALDTGGSASSSDVLGEQDQEAGTPLTDTGEVLGMMDSKLFGIAWYWWLAIVAALIGGWLLIAAAIRRSREEA